MRHRCGRHAAMAREQQAEGPHGRGALGQGEARRLGRGAGGGAPGFSSAARPSAGAPRASRCTWPGFPAAHIPGRVHLEVCGTGVQRHTRSGKRRSTNEKARILRGVRASEESECGGTPSGAALSRMQSIFGLAMAERLLDRAPDRRRQFGTHERTQALDGLGVASGEPAGHDGVSWFWSDDASLSGTPRLQWIEALSSDRTNSK